MTKSHIVHVTIRKMGQRRRKLTEGWDSRTLVGRTWGTFNLRVVPDLFGVSWLHLHNFEVQSIQNATPMVMKLLQTSCCGGPQKTWLEVFFRLSVFFILFTKFSIIWNKRNCKPKRTESWDSRVLA